MIRAPGPRGTDVRVPSRYRAVQLPTVLFLTAVWWALWGTWSMLSLVGGVLVALAVCVVFPLPPLRLRVRVRPLALVVLVAVFLRDVVVASVQVIGVTLGPQDRLSNALVAVPLRTGSDIVLTAVAELVTLVPGSVVVEAHRASHTLFLHSLDVHDAAGVERVRERVWAQEARVVAAFGGTPYPAPAQEVAP